MSWVQEQREWWMKAIVRQAMCVPTGIETGGGLEVMWDDGSVMLFPKHHITEGEINSGYVMQTFGISQEDIRASADIPENWGCYHHHKHKDFTHLLSLRNIEEDFYGITIIPEVEPERSHIMRITLPTKEFHKYGREEDDNIKELPFFIRVWVRIFEMIDNIFDKK
jgi:hypothetical protein